MSSYDNWSATGRAPDDADDEGDLRALLDADDAWRRRDAALALVDAAATGLESETAGALAETARDDADENVRQFAVEALGIAGCRPDAIRAALDDDNEWVRAEAVVALSRTAPDDIETIRAALDADESGWVRRNAVIALGKVNGVSEERLVACIKNDPIPAVREYAAQFLPDVAEDVERAVRLLAALLAREPNAFVRAKAAQGLGELGTDRAEQALETHGVTDASDDVARAAKQALAAARGVEPDQLSIDVDDAERGAPGTGPDTPGDRDVDGFRTGGPSGAPGGAPGFDPTSDLETNPQDRY